MTSRPDTSTIPSALTTESRLTDFDVEPTPTTTTSEVTWTPGPEELDRSAMARFARWCEEHRGVDLPDFRALLRWSVDDLNGFWSAVREFFDVIGDGFDDAVPLAEDRMPFASWFPGVRLNFSENVLRHAQNPDTRETDAIITVDEDSHQTTITWAELETQVASLANRLRQLGVEPGDRVAAVLPNIPEAIIGLLATTSIGAVWTINGPDLSAEATVRRISQLEPKVLVAGDGYVFNGKPFDRREHTEIVESGLPSLEHTILVRTLGPGDDAGVMNTPERNLRHSFDELTDDPDAQPNYLRVPFDHPLWVLFSSGTTGAPKGIVHGHGGMTLDGLKQIGLHQDMSSSERYYVAANTSWMVWNTLVQNLLTGASVVTYSGSPRATRKDHHFQIIADTGTTMFATGAAYLSMVEKSGIDPREGRDLSRLRSILSTGSPLPESTWLWVHSDVKSDVHLGSDSGGTDICGGFLGSNPLEPVHLGRLQGPLLGIAVEAQSPDGRRLIDEVGEQAITRPLPSMPICLWNDPDGSRYRKSYFTSRPGVWMHGDWVTEKPSGEFIVHGRADATLNRQGVRIGPADIYSALQDVDEITDSMVIGVEEPDGGYWMPLFVVLAEDVKLTEELKERIRQTLATRTSKRHVPDEIISAPGIPTTRTMKRLEVPVKKLFAPTTGGSPVNRDSVQNLDVLEWYEDFARARARGTASATQR